MSTSIWTFMLPAVFLVCSLPIFLKVYNSTKMVIDEEFHLRQGLHFCNKNFNKWDSKITTFPGLYMAAVALNPLDMCNVFGLRLLSLIAATMNIILFYKIRRFNLNFSHNFDAALDALSLAMLPPLYFFSHLYYTDVMSLTFVLLFYYNWLKDERLYAAVFAAASVLMRQTNIIWIGMSIGITALKVLFSNYANKKGLRNQNVHIFDWSAWREILTSFDIIWKSIWQTFVRSCLLLLVILPFFVFVILNGSIVVGDKSAHEATWHLPQLFYFSLFTTFFAISNTLQNLKPTLRLMMNEKLICLFVLGVFILIVKWNTLVHPYLLADNRHYTFYLWNRFYGRYNWFRYAITPAYLFGLFLMLYGLRGSQQNFQLMFFISIILVLCFQRLLEIRYFFIPYVLFRLHMMHSRHGRKYQYLELLIYIILNILTFYIFFTKEIQWQNYEEAQRIIW